MRSREREGRSGIPKNMWDQTTRRNTRQIKAERDRPTSTNTHTIHPNDSRTSITSNWGPTWTHRRRYYLVLRRSLYAPRPLGRGTDPVSCYGCLVRVVATSTRLHTKPAMSTRQGGVQSRTEDVPRRFSLSRRPPRRAAVAAGTASTPWTMSSGGVVMLVQLLLPIVIVHEPWHPDTRTSASPVVHSIDSANQDCCYHRTAMATKTTSSMAYTRGYPFESGAVTTMPNWCPRRFALRMGKHWRITPFERFSTLRALALEQTMARERSSHVAYLY